MTSTTKSRKKRGSLGHVLVVEDDAILCMAIEQALLDGGARSVHCCASTDAALAELESRRPDLVILDVHLADRDDGWAIAELLTQLGPKPPRIVFSTANPGVIPAHIAELGTILEKPYAPETLIAALQASPRKVGLIGRLLGEPATSGP
ncbi:MAG TPA: response regulator [Novosphingobium sp.]|nr:response regulator [Novosphingobium sp.]